MPHSATNGLSILITLAFIVFTSPYFSRFFRIPISPVEIILGMIAGHLGLIGHNDLFELISEVGFFYLMFLAGTEVDLRIFLSADRTILKQGIIYISLLYILSAILVFFSGLNALLIVIIPLMSVGMIFTLIKEYGKNEQWLNLGMLIGSIGEVISIMLLTFVAAYLQFGASLNLWLSITYLTIFIAVTIFGFKLFDVLFWWYPRLKIILMPHHDKDEKDIRLCMSLFAAVIALMLYLDLEIAFGAFISGTFIATFFEHKQDLPHKLSSFGFGFLVPAFFVYIGSTFDISALFIDGVVLNAVLIVFVMIGFRLICALIFLKLLGFKDTVLYALSHSMPLTLIIAVATIAHKAGNISESFYYSFILASLLQAIISLIGIKLLMNLKQRGRHVKYSNSHR